MKTLVPVMLTQQFFFLGMFLFLFCQIPTICEHVCECVTLLFVHMCWFIWCIFRYPFSDKVNCVQFKCNTKHWIEFEFDDDSSGWADHFILFSASQIHSIDKEKTKKK